VPSWSASTPVLTEVVSSMRLLVTYWSFWNSEAMLGGGGQVGHGRGGGRLGVGLGAGEDIAAVGRGVQALDHVAERAAQRLHQGLGAAGRHRVGDRLAGALGGVADLADAGVLHVQAVGDQAGLVEEAGDLGLGAAHGGQHLGVLGIALEVVGDLLAGNLFAGDALQHLGAHQVAGHHAEIAGSGDAGHGLNL
jgi:hypothetical protein